MVSSKYFIEMFYPKKWIQILVLNWFHPSRVLRVLSFNVYCSEGWMKRFLFSLSTFLLKQCLREKRGRNSCSCFGADVFIERRGQLLIFQKWVSHVLDRFKISDLCNDVLITLSQSETTCKMKFDFFCVKRQITRIRMWSNHSMGTFVTIWVHTLHSVRVVTTATNH